MILDSVITPHKQTMLFVFLLAQLREKFQVESLAERSCVIKGCSMQDTGALKKILELLVDELLPNTS